MSAIGDGIDILKLVNKGANADLYGKIGRLIDEARDLYSERERLEVENKELREQLRFKGTFVRVGGFVFQEGNDELLCSRCADVDNKPIHVGIVRSRELGNTVVCPQCKNQQRRFVTRSELEQEIKAKQPPLS